jgi:ATP-dependent DNA helicase RecQ
MDEGPLTRLRVNPQEIARRAALEQRKLREMINFCYTDRCYRSFVLDYFGDKHHKPNCGSCGNCTLANRRSVNLQPDHTSTDLDRFVIQNAPLGTDLEIELASNSRKKSVAERAEQHLETSSGRTLDEQEMLIVRKILSCVARMKGKFGKSMVAATLRGSNSLKIKSSSLDQLSTFGILNHLTQDQIIAYIDSLVVTRCLELSRGEFPTIRLTDLGGEVMKGLCSISLPLSPQIVKKIKAKTVSTVDETYKLYQQGLGIEEISEKRGLTVQTVEGHLADCIREGRPFDLQTYVNSDQRSQIVDAVNRLGTERLKPIREALSAEISYRMIRFVVAEMSRPKDDPETEEKGNPPQPPLPPDQKGPSSPVREPEEPPPVKEPPPKEPSRIMFSSGK